MTNPPVPHRSRFAVRYHETDQMGVVHHAVYIHWLEVGRTEMMKTHGLDYAQMERDGVLLTVAETRVRHLAPIRFGSEVVVETRVAQVERVRVRFDYRVLEAATAVVAAEGMTVLACVDPQLRLRRIPEAVRDRLLALAAASV